MASVKVIQRLDKINTEGKAPIFLRIIQDRKTSFISLGIYLKPSEWNQDEQRVRKSHANSGRFNQYITQKKSEAEGTALDLADKKQRTTGKIIKNEIMGLSSGEFFEFAENYYSTVERSGKIGSYRKIKGVVEKLKKYHNDQPLLMSEITVEFLVRYQDYLSGTLKNKTNTITSNFKVLKRIMKDAINQGKMKRADYPFYSFTLKTEPSKRSFLTESELEAIEKLKLQKSTRLELARDMYIFSAYAGGIRISDLLQMKWSNYDGERLSFKITKTSRELVIKLPDSSINILKKYQTSDSKLTDFIFPFLSNDIDLKDPTILHNAISSATALGNKNLKIIAGKAKVNKSISFHTARHTFATRALRKGIRIEYVSRLLGHSSIKETQVYAKIVNEELDKAMDVFNQPKEVNVKVSKQKVTKPKIRKQGK